MTKVGGIRKIMVFWQAVFLAASPLVTAPPPNLTRLLHNTASYAVTKCLSVVVRTIDLCAPKSLPLNE